MRPLRRRRSSPIRSGAWSAARARTVVHRPPDPRVGAAIVGTVVLGVARGPGDRAAQPLDRRQPRAPDHRRTPRRAAGRAAPVSPAPAPAAIADWPVGLSGWTVVLGRRRTQRPRADARAAPGRPGPLRPACSNSSQHPHLQAGYFVVFSGRYPTKARRAGRCWRPARPWSAAGARAAGGAARRPLGPEPARSTAPTTAAAAPAPRPPAGCPPGCRRPPASPAPASAAIVTATERASAAGAYPPSSTAPTGAPIVAAASRTRHAIAANPASVTAQSASGSSTCAS